MKLVMRIFGDEILVDAKGKFFVKLVWKHKTVVLEEPYETLDQATKAATVHGLYK